MEKYLKKLIDKLEVENLRLSNAYDRVCKENRRLVRENKKLAKEIAAAREVRNMLCDFVVDELHINEWFNSESTLNCDERGNNNAESGI